MSLQSLQSQNQEQADNLNTNRKKSIKNFYQSGAHSKNFESHHFLTELLKETSNSLIKDQDSIDNQIVLDVQSQKREKILENIKKDFKQEKTTLEKNEDINTCTDKSSKRGVCSMIKESDVGLFLDNISQLDGIVKIIIDNIDSVISSVDQKISELTSSDQTINSDKIEENNKKKDQNFHPLTKKHELMSINRVSVDEDNYKKMSQLDELMYLNRQEYVPTVNSSMYSGVNEGIFHDLSFGADAWTEEANTVMGDTRVSKTTYSQYSAPNRQRSYPGSKNFNTGFGAGFSGTGNDEALTRGYSSETVNNYYAEAHVINGDDNSTHTNTDGSTQENTLSQQHLVVQNEILKQQLEEQKKQLEIFKNQFEVLQSQLQNLLQQANEDKITKMVKDALEAKQINQGGNELKAVIDKVLEQGEMTYEFLKDMMSARKHGDNAFEERLLRLLEQLLQRIGGGGFMSHYPVSPYPMGTAPNQAVFAGPAGQQATGVQNQDSQKRQKTHGVYKNKEDFAVSEETAIRTGNNSEFDASLESSVKKSSSSNRLQESVKEDNEEIQGDYFEIMKSYYEKWNLPKNGFGDNNTHMTEAFLGAMQTNMGYGAEDRLSSIKGGYKHSSFWELARAFKKSAFPLKELKGYLANLMPRGDKFIPRACNEVLLFEDKFTLNAPYFHPYRQLVRELAEPKRFKKLKSDPKHKDLFSSFPEKNLGKMNYFDWIKSLNKIDQAQKAKKEFCDFMENYCVFSKSVKQEDILSDQEIEVIPQQEAIIKIKEKLKEIHEYCENPKTLNGTIIPNPFAKDAGIDFSETKFTMYSPGNNFKTNFSEKSVSKKCKSLNLNKITSSLSYFDDNWNVSIGNDSMELDQLVDYEKKVIGQFFKKEGLQMTLLNLQIYYYNLGVLMNILRDFDSDQKLGLQILSVGENKCKIIPFCLDSVTFRGSMIYPSSQKKSFIFIDSVYGTEFFKN